jgi:hypothetical protein
LLFLFTVCNSFVRELLSVWTYSHPLPASRFVWLYISKFVWSCCRARPYIIWSTTHSLELTRMFRLKPDSRFAERYHSVVSCALNAEGLIWNKISVNSVTDL